MKSRMKCFLALAMVAMLALGVATGAWALERYSKPISLKGRLVQKAGVNAKDAQAVEEEIVEIEIPAEETDPAEEAPETEPEVTAEAVLEPEAEVEPEAELDPEAETEPETEPEAELEAELEPEAEAEPELEPEIEAETEPATETPAAPEAANDVVEMRVNIYTTLSDQVEEGERITLTSELIGFDGVEGILYQWQYNDGADWHDVPGATGANYEYEISAQNAAYAWRLKVSFDE